ncbi:aminotransferase class V-fold PLP-dependent enzyme [Streptomyces sp. NPDC020742]|uniref:aminotransferase class V-fold PLP-dependent enzyme n=1 Tax=Streptomyces sp. NPDC020742 TaxID=3154897 RepID=UPI0033CECB93
MRKMALVGDRQWVPLVTGGEVRRLDLDYAATAPCALQVRDAVDEILPWYGSVHRGDGFPSAVCTELQEACRESVRAFTGARPDDTVIFTRNTTDSLNLLAHALPEDGEVFGFATEHHANLLPWDRRTVHRLPVPDSPAHALELLDAALASAARAAGRGGGARLVTLAGASNVTGEVWPVAELAGVARRFGARTAVDAAQLAPHRPLDMAGWDVDYVAFSGHKLYAPYGAGALVGRPDWLDAAPPYLAGGGATRQVDLPAVDWAPSPQRHEAGSPNFLGNYALATACELLHAPLRSGLVVQEQRLAALLERELARIPGLTVHRMWDARHPKVGTVTFSVRGVASGLLSAALSAEHGIAVRTGRFCAHPLVKHLLGEGHADGAALRASIGAGITEQDISDFAWALARLVERGPAWSYRRDGARFVPDPDPRPMPALSHGARVQLRAAERRAEAPLAPVGAACGG